MSLVDAVHHDGLNSFELVPDGSYALLTDGDNTLFAWGQTDLYPDSQRVLDALSPAVTALVTGDNNADLAHTRAEVIGAQVCKFPQRKHWNKWGLYKDALAEAQAVADFDSVLVLGDRWLMDVTMGKLAARRSGYHVQGVLVLRDDEPLPTAIDAKIIHPLEEVGAKIATAIKVDRFFRPV